MKKLLLGMLIGAAITTGVFYFINKNAQKENTTELVEYLKQEQAKTKQTAETINDPKSVMAEHALTIVLSTNNELYYYTDKDCSKIEKTNYTSIKAILEAEKKRTNPEDLMILIKTGDGASFKNSIDLLDAITIAGIPAGHFAEVDLSEKEKNCLQNYKTN